MSKQQQILVPVDFSEHSRATVRHAAALAKALSAELQLLHVWQVPEFVPPDLAPGPAYGSKTLTSLLEALAKERLQAFVDDTQASGIAVAGSSTDSGAPSQVIVGAAAAGKCDLVVMGTHGRTGLEHAFVGSVAERVVRHAPCPVMSLTPAACGREAGIRKILVPVDYSDSAGAALSYATTLAERLGATLDIVHVWDRPRYVAETTVVHTETGERRALGELVREAAEREMAEFLSKRLPAAAGQKSPPHRLLSGEPASALLAELGQGRHDAVVVGTHGRTGIRHLLLGSIAEKLVRLSPVPVVTVPRPTA